MQDAINLALIQQLWMLGFDRLEFDGHLFARGHVGAQVNVTKGPGANLPAQAVFFSHPELHVDCMSNSNDSHSPLLQLQQSTPYTL